MGILNDIGGAAGSVDGLISDASNVFSAAKNPTFDLDFDVDGAVQKATAFIDNKTNGNASYLVNNCNQMMDVANSVERIVNGGYDTVLSTSVTGLVSQAKNFAVDTAVDQVTTFLGNSEIGSFVSDNATKVMGYMTSVDNLLSLPSSIPSLPSIGELGNVFGVAKTLSVNSVIGMATSFAGDSIGSLIPSQANTMLSAIGAVQNLSIPSNLSLDSVSIISSLLPAKAKAVVTAVRNVRNITKSVQSIHHLIGNPNAIFSALGSVEALLAAGIDISALGFPMGLLGQAKSLASTMTGMVSSVSSIVSSIGGFF